MRQLYVIGVGAGDPEQVTVQAIRALNAVDVFFVLDKGSSKEDLVALRTEICRRYITDRPYRIVEVADPERDRSSMSNRQYGVAVKDWHEARVEAIEQAMLVELAPGENPGFLVWGDPAIYDSIIRIVEGLQARAVVPFEFQVIPGISSVQQLAAAHRIVLNRIGEPIHITTGRRLGDRLPVGQNNVIVMLDSQLACQALTEPGLEIYWGAYLGSPEQILVHGVLADVIDEIVDVRAAARERIGWIMDTYLIRRPV